MKLVLCYCWKEWRAQRGLLLAYVGLIFTCLCLGLSLAPTHYWFDEGLGVHALSWFVAAGVIGVVAFVAPNLVRAEYGPKDDLFIRRLPGALWPAFGGKALFLVLAATILPLLGLLVGEFFVELRGSDWNELYRWTWDGAVEFRWPGIAVLCGLAMLLVPWVWAIGLWMPGGRMAFGGTVLFVLLIGVVVFAVLRQSPGLEKGIAWSGWLWGIVPLGFLTAAISFVRGRRGGGPLRSARLGLLISGAGLLAPGLWFALAAVDYHHPEPNELVEIQVQGLSPDGRYAIVRGAEHRAFADVTFRVDLQTGWAEQVTGVREVLSRDIGSPFSPGTGGTCRYWTRWDEHGARGIFDLTTGETRTDVDYDEAAGKWILPPALQRDVANAYRAESRMRMPNGRAFWLHQGFLHQEQVDGSVVKKPWPMASAITRRIALRPAGHGVAVSMPEPLLFDWNGNKLAVQPEGVELRAAYVVRSVAVYLPRGQSVGLYRRLDSAGEVTICEALRDHRVLGLSDHDTLLCKSIRRQRGDRLRLLLYRPADERVTEIDVPGELPFENVSVIPSLASIGSLIARDPLGRIWLHCHAAKASAVVALDPSTGRLSEPLPVGSLRSGYNGLLDWPDRKSALVRDRTRIVKVDVDTGVRTVLFPRPSR